MPLQFNQPLVILMLGLPGAGKSYFARQFANQHKLGYISDDRIRFELYDDPQYSDQENALVLSIMDLMCEQLLVGNSVVYDGNLYSRNMRKQRELLGKQSGASTLTVWVQTDLQTTYYRATHRDGRRPDDRYVPNISEPVFDKALRLLNRPDREDYVVISGKHSFAAQNRAVINKLASLKLVDIPQRTKKIESDRTETKKVSRVDIQRRIIPRQR